MQANTRNELNTLMDNLFNDKNMANDANELMKNRVSRRKKLHIPDLKSLERKFTARDRLKLKLRQKQDAKFKQKQEYYLNNVNDIRKKQKIYYEKNKKDNVCPHCNNKFASKSSMKRHIGRKH